MKKLQVLIVFLMIFAVSCGSAQKKEEPAYRSARSDSSVKIISPDFKFENIKKIYLYNEVENEDNKAILLGIAAKLKEKGIEAVIDSGETMKYENDDLRVKTFNTLMSVYYNVAILKPRGQKGNEEKVATIKGDSILRVVDKTIEFIFQ